MDNHPGDDLIAAGFSSNPPVDLNGNKRKRDEDESERAPAPPSAQFNGPNVPSVLQPAPPTSLAFPGPPRRDDSSNDSAGEEIEEEEIEREPGTEGGSRALEPGGRRVLEDSSDDGNAELDEIDELESVAGDASPASRRNDSRRGSGAGVAAGSSHASGDAAAKRRKAGAGRPKNSKDGDSVHSGDTPARKKRKTNEDTPKPKSGLTPEPHSVLRQPKKFDKAKRPPPLEMHSGSHELPPPSAGLMTDMRSAAIISPVIAAFPFHRTDKATRDAFKNSINIKDQQRSLIQQRKDGVVPSALESPGLGPPPSAGPIPSLLTYIPDPEVVAANLAEKKAKEDREREERERIARLEREKAEEERRHAAMRAAEAERLNRGPDNHSDDSDEDDDAAREAAGYDANGNSYYDMERRRAAAMRANGEGPSHRPPGPHPPFEGYTSHAPRRSSKHPSSSVHIPPFHPPPGHMMPPHADGRGYAYPGHPHHPPPPGSAGPRMPPYPYYGGQHPPPFPGGPPPGAPLPPPPPGFYDRERDAFMSHFSKFYDALLDSTQLRNDLATKIHKANELVAAHQIELRKVENLRGQYEMALADLKGRSKKMMRDIASGNISNLDRSGSAGEDDDVNMD